MGKQAAPRSADPALLSAALRHLRDAEHLAEATSPHTSLDQAYHLAGFGPECARKAAIDASWANKILGHDLGDDAEDVLELALALDPHAARYDVRGWEQAYPALAAWKPTCRYAATRTYDRPRVQRLLQEAQRAVAELMAALWADGRLSLDDLR